MILPKTLLKNGIVLAISTQGVVSTQDRLTIKSNQYKEYEYTVKGKELTPTSNGFGYLQVPVSNNGKIKRYYVHRLVFEAFVGTIPIDKEIDHIDGIRGNNKLSNLQLLTRKENLDKRVLNKKTQKYSCSVCSIKITKNNSTGICMSCRSTRPEKEVLLSEILNSTFDKVGSKYGVSGNAVKKWCKAYEIPHLRSELDKL